MHFQPPQHLNEMPDFLKHIESGNVDYIRQWIAGGQVNLNHKAVLRELIQGVSHSGGGGEFGAGGSSQHYAYYIYNEKAPLVIAAHSGNLDMVKLLVESGADVNITTISFTQPNQSNCCSSEEECEEAAKFSYVSPLGAALIHGNFEMANYLIDHGADMTCITKYKNLYLKGNDGQSNEGGSRYTTLMLALRWDAPAEFLERLIKGGVDLEHSGHFQIREMDEEWTNCFMGGIVVLWIPCIVGSLLSRDCRGCSFRSLDFTAEQQAEELGNDEALAMIKAGLSDQEAASSAAAASASISP